MPKHILDAAWEIEFDNKKHIVRLERPYNAIAHCRLYFDQEVVGQRFYWYGPSAQFEFYRGGHVFETKFVWTEDQYKLIIDGVPAKGGTLTVIPPRTTDSSATKPSSTGSSVAQPASGYELVSEDNVREDSEVISTEEYPLDNRAGAESVTIEHEISRTVSNEMSVGNTTQKDSGISLELLNLIKGGLSAKLIKQTGQTLGETVTRRHSIKFSASPHQAVTYLVVWKRRLRTGNYLVLNNGTYITIPYTAYFDLTFEVQSR